MEGKENKMLSHIAQESKGHAIWARYCPAVNYEPIDEPAIIDQISHNGLEVYPTVASTSIPQPASGRRKSILPLLFPLHSLEILAEQPRIRNSER